MEMLTTVLLGMLGGLLGWFATTFAAEPIHHYRVLRRTAEAALSEFGNAGPVNKPTQAQLEWSNKRVETARYEIRKQAVALSALAATQPLVCRLLKVFGHDVRSAASNLMGYSNSLHEWSMDRHEFAVGFRRALKIPRI